MKNEELKLPRELVIPTKLLFNKEIECEYKQLYMYISYRASTRGYIWYQNDTLADHLGKSTRAIERALKSLSDAKWIKIENRVKKSDLYHQDMRRVIWIYSDYLVALDKGGYGVAKPLAFSTWKKKFIAALIDHTKIPQIMQFHPVVKKMGEMEIMYDVNSKSLFAYMTDYEAAPDKRYSTRKLTSTEASEAFKTLYDYYCSLHPEKTEKKERNDITDFKNFQSYIRNDYIDRTIVIIDCKELTVNGLGLLMKIGKDGKEITLDADKAIEIWQWLFDNQNLIMED